MHDLIDRQAAIKALNNWFFNSTDDRSPKQVIEALPSAQPTLRERALMLLLNWAVECDFGYDNFPEEYERYKNEVEGMSYFDGMIYIAEKEVERNG